MHAHLWARRLPSTPAVRKAPSGKTILCERFDLFFGRRVRNAWRCARPRGRTAGGRVVVVCQRKLRTPNGMTLGLCASPACGLLACPVHSRGETGFQRHRRSRTTWLPTSTMRKSSLSGPRRAGDAPARAGTSPRDLAHDPAIASLDDSSGKYQHPVHNGTHRGGDACWR